MTNRSIFVAPHVALVIAFLGVAVLAGCMPVREHVASASTSAADVSAATAECEGFACQP